jgi:hypothetical protein
MTEREIIALRRAGARERFGSIYSAVTYANGRRYHFVEREIPGTGCLVRLPREFFPMPPNIARQKYPSESRPGHIMTSSDTRVNFAFTAVQRAVKHEELTKVRNAAVDALRRLFPHYVYAGTGLEYFGEKGDQVFSWYEYRSPTLDVEAYSFQAFLGARGRLLAVTFNCPADWREGWRPIVFEVVSSIREKPIDWREEEGE